MEIKKSYKADLDNHRASGFLIGLVVVLSLFLGALEFTTHSGLPETGDDILEDISQDIEMTPVIHRDDMVAAAPKSPKSPQKQQGSKLNIVDRKADDETVSKPLLDINDLNSQLGVGVGGVTDISNAPISLVAPSTEDDNPLDFHVVEQLPEFPGGMSKFVQWLTKRLKYPITAQRAKKEGTVLVSFIINKDGTTTGHKIVRSAGAEFDGEALRVLRQMPKWTPGKDKGQPCRTYFCIPIVFKL